MTKISVRRFCESIPWRKYPYVAVSSGGWLNKTNQYLPELLNAKKLIVPKNDKAAKKCAGFVQWGILESESKRQLREHAAKLKRPLAFIEDGFIRSLGLGLSQEPGRSIILDDLTFYYDATKPSRLETILNSSEKIGFWKRRQALKAITFITKHKVSKYNNAPEKLPDSLTAERRRRRILLIDQRAGDASIAGALASDENFRFMLERAFEDADAEVIVKIHPDALCPGKSSAISPSLSAYEANKRLTIVSDAVNPYSLFAAVDEVYVVASGMGFEALMAGKPVTCFGVPYYAGWGVTTDAVTIPRRTQRRTIEEIFFVAWMQMSRYVDPKSRRLVSVMRAARIMAEDVATAGSRPTS
ncbi:capsule polysaccharide export protein [Shinella sp. DD12]|nr:capsule polysaccharide export protein [Shinella sp. DD12]